MVDVMKCVILMALLKSNIPSFLQLYQVFPQKDDLVFHSTHSFLSHEHHCINSDKMHYSVLTLLF